MGFDFCYAIKSVNLCLTSEITFYCSVKLSSYENKTKKLLFQLTVLGCYTKGRDKVDTFMKLKKLFVGIY